MTERGFTLVEVLVAFSLLALVLGAAYGTFGTGSRALARSDAALGALTLAENMLARIGPEIALAPGRHVERAGPWTVTARIAPHLPRSAPTWAAIGLEPLDVTVEVSAPGMGATTLRTLRLRGTE